jgi:ABC-type multidrug transport system ATPase subunit
MNVLAGRVGGRVEGTVLLNGELMVDMSYVIKSLSNFIPQEDTLMFTLTPRETLRYIFNLHFEHVHTEC